MAEFEIADIISVLGWVVAVASLALTMRRDSSERRKDHDEQVEKSEHLAGQMESLSKSIGRLQQTLDKVDGYVFEDRKMIARLDEQVKTIFNRLTRLEDAHERRNERHERKDEE